MPLPFKELLSSTLDYMWVFLHENSSSHVTSSASRFFHLMRYSIITRFLYCLVLVSKIVSSSSIIFPSSLISSRRVLTRILSLIAFFKQETWKIGCTREAEGSSNSFFHVSFSTTSRSSYSSLMILHIFPSCCHFIFSSLT